jgi:hypothetical protein
MPLVGLLMLAAVMPLKPLTVTTLPATVVLLDVP